MLDAARVFLTRSPLVGPEAWRRAIETLSLVLGAFFVTAGLGDASVCVCVCERAGVRVCGCMCDACMHACVSTIPFCCLPLFLT